MAQNAAFITYQEAARLTGKTVRTIQRHIKTGVIAASQTRHNNGHVTIAVAELERVFGKLTLPDTDMSRDTVRHVATFDPDMSRQETGVLREYLDFTKQQLEWEQRRNDRLESALQDMRDDLKRTQEQLSRLLPPGGQGVTPGGDMSRHVRGNGDDNVRPPRRWQFWKR